MISIIYSKLFNPTKEIGEEFLNQALVEGSSLYEPTIDEIINIQQISIGEHYARFMIYVKTKEQT